ncbi:MAG: HAMP domain-containing sensor histidine kinase [Deinococcales bacterium]
MITPSRNLTRIAFSVIILFVLAQVFWWVMFQQIYVRRVTNMLLESWQLDLVSANDLLSQGVEAGHLVQRYPKLRFNGETFELSATQVDQFIAEQRRHLRMFMWEGGFFVLAVLFGLWVIYLSLKTERLLKKQQQNFLSAITHEFKTPIATLKLLIQSAQKRQLSLEKQQDYWQKMALELSRLEASSEQVLAAARLEHSPPNLQTTDLLNLIQDLSDKAKNSLEARGAKLELNLPKTPLKPFNVMVNPDAFALVLNNLFDNAIKYSPQMPKPIRLKLSQDDYLVRIDVEDEGIGIDKKEVKKVFEKFYRSGNELTRQSKGVGLGLHLVKSTIEAMNGWVRCEPLAKGSRFSIMLPLMLEDDP